MHTNHTATNVVRFRPARSWDQSRRDQKHLMEAVYAAGSLPVHADDTATKAMAARLQLFGFVVIEEIQTDGTARRLRASESTGASAERPWRVSKGAAAPGAPVSVADPFDLFSDHPRSA